ncbi:MAG: 30S ribosomal protein S7 [Clostridia bacterium]|nr:30S ribosomal protein S7 [Clostridia bacterium]MBQ7047871.1 30S ribosomal protein S7 [Clostridia bacterium]
MPRRVHGFKRDVLPDPMYNSTLVTKLTNQIMYDGKKGVAQKIVYDAFAMVEAKTGANALEQFQKALENIMPNLEVKSVRRGGSNYQVPMEVRAERRQTLGLRWLVNYARTRSDRKMYERLANEIIDATNNLGGAVKKKDDTHRMAEANKAFAHYKW